MPLPRMGIGASSSMAPPAIAVPSPLARVQFLLDLFKGNRLFLIRTGLRFRLQGSLRPELILVLPLRLCCQFFEVTLRQEDICPTADFEGSKSHCGGKNSIRLRKRHQASY